MNYTEKKICTSMINFNNGASPTWCQGSSTITRVGKDVFATNMRLHEDRKGWYPSVSMELYAKRDGGEWQLEYADEGMFQREPCPVVNLGGSLIGVTVNPAEETYPPDPESEGCPSTPKMYVFDVSGPAKLVRTVTLRWDDPTYCFVVHSYRGNAVDQENGDLFFTNQFHKTYSKMYREEDEGEHCWSLLDKEYRYLRGGKLSYPERSCYQSICMKDGECYVFAVKDIIEPVDEWRKYKLEMTGNVWDYDFRVIYLLYSPDIRTTDFEPARVIVDRDSTAGSARNIDCAYDQDGDMWMVYSASRIWHDFMRERFFPDTKFEKTLELVRMRAGQEISRMVIDRSEEYNGENPNTEYGAVLHTLADGSLKLIWSKNNGPAEDAVSGGLYVYDLKSRNQERVADPLPGGEKNALLKPIFSSSRRLGTQPCDIADLYWLQTQDSEKWKAGDLINSELRF